MCGIFGLVLRSDARFDRKQVPKLITRFYALAESRGKEAAGLAVVLRDRIEVVKRPVRARRFLRDPETRAVLRAVVEATAADDPLIVLGHTRMVTNGSPDNPDNNQPVIRDDLIGLHNGIVVNDGELWGRHPELDRTYEVDTEVILAIVAQARRDGGTLATAVARALVECRGANSIALLGAGDDMLALATTNGSLFFVHAHDGSALMFASERYILEQISGESRVRQVFAGMQPIQLLSREGAIAKFRDLRPERFVLPPPGASMDLVDVAGFPADARHEAERRIVDHRESKPARLRPVVGGTCLRDLERLMAVDQVRIGNLKRCTKCLLPETFPFISFDDAGVCQFCRNPQPVRRHTEAELDAIVMAHRGRGGEADCLVPISGGRDSCYSLHYVKTVLGLKPVAYTYDWGMVTDLARRNVSRMCEALGVEHLLIAADIRRKREFIRMNVSAWLKRPHLGTIPLFMAGDKQFFYYSDLLRRQMNLPLVIFSMNRLERTDFKVGFCGIRDDAIHSKTYGLTAANKARLMTFYATEFLLNPGFINGSLLDSASAYASYYMLPQSYISLFDYIDWGESRINETIVDQYDWETATDSRSTWRVGDGTAPFYNYIYYKVAGFSEHDTFRSNQIRSGLLTREQALGLLSEENLPRVESFKWYCDTIGIDATETVRRINAIPELYA
jgi:hypothetical protein